MYEKSALIVWINDKPGDVTVKTDDGYHRFKCEQVLRIEWTPRAVLVQRWSEVGAVKLWGFDTPEGFASFGPLGADRELAIQCAEQYNAGQHKWVYLPKHLHPLCAVQERIVKNGQTFQPEASQLD